MSFTNVLAIEPNMSRIARLCGVTPQAVHQWKALDVVPRDHVRTLCEQLGMRPHDVRPDLFESTWRYPHAKRSSRRSGGR